jgi:predicted CXXCH cytochrome family protein
LKKLTLLIAAGALWLFLAAVPAVADGGPHVAVVNSGAGVGSTLTADSCAGCHRAHTAQGPLLLAAPDEEALCLSCHGAAGTGSAVDVESGVQYTTDSRTGSNVLGALRNGGFINARIDSANPFRVTYMRSATAVSERTKVSVRSSGQPVTSSHLALASGVVATGIAWGNLAGTPGTSFSGTSNPGGTIDGMTCASCHNPHGNGNYRILNPIPAPETVTGDTFVAATVGVSVTDAALPQVGETRNYTVIQTINGTGTLLASQVQGLPGYNNLMGDYFHRSVPWDPQVPYTAPPPAGTTANDAPNGLAASFNGQINQWCAQCHSRYLAVTAAPYQNNSGDAIFTYRHSNTNNKPCTTCHVAHGTNATMPGGTNTSFATDFPYPDGSISDSSRLLKIDNRGTCQACHDPTGTVAAGVFSGPTPANYAP